MPERSGVPDVRRPQLQQKLLRLLGITRALPQQTGLSWVHRTSWEVICYTISRRGILQVLEGVRQHGHMHNAMSRLMCVMRLGYNLYKPKCFFCAKATIIEHSNNPMCWRSSQRVRCIFLMGSSSLVSRGLSSLTKVPHFTG